MFPHNHQRKYGGTEVKQLLWSNLQQRIRQRDQETRKQTQQLLKWKPLLFTEKAEEAVSAFHQ